MRGVPKRLGTFGLRLNSEKTRLVAFGKPQAWRAFREGAPLPPCAYLGFTPYWGRRRTGKARLKRKTAAARGREDRDLLVDHAPVRLVAGAQGALTP